MPTYYQDIQEKLGIIIVHDFPSTTAQTSTNYGLIATLPFPYEILSVTEKHTVAGTSPVLDVLYVANGSAIGSTSVLATTFDLSSTANTAIIKSGLDLSANRSFKPKDSIALKLTGTAGLLEGVQITIYIKPLNRGEFK